ncbi:hypothetical protein C1I98_30455 [Spongiactinospora gelatinilytica]|uniref:Mur ligase N-terminal catalytic domain-containing protein n=1 Tax=Spongiactinospora gelatinilytica TaxID=2666298 RepID=A0A2W2GA09_9ACTN|nr:hypothetical protein C1I98_30455 [Spongiactinospora gelatinilytica]
MIMTLAEIADATGGTLHDVPDPQARVTGRSAADSRHVAPGGMFVAVAGTRVDGHDFAAQAIAAGAACVLASHPVGVPAVVTDDVVAALGRLAQHALTRTGAQIIALTGSSGKTSTKDLLAQVLAGHGETVATPGSFNTEIGLPLTVLGAAPSTRYLILEMGASSSAATEMRPSRSSGMVTTSAIVSRQGSSLEWCSNGPMNTTGRSAGGIASVSR